MLYVSSGILKYDKKEGYGHKLTLTVDPEIVLLYRSLIPKYIEIQPQKYAPHISVVRRETVQNLQFWDKYEGEEIEFEYSPVIRSGTVYYWLDVYSKRLESIRRELGLPVDSQFSVPPLGYSKTFHFTLGNCK